MRSTTEPLETIRARTSGATAMGSRLATTAAKTVAFRTVAFGALSFALLFTAGCHKLLSPPPADDAQIRPDKIVDFDQLYKANCAGCHGADGKNGPAIALNNPTYLAVVSDDQMRNVTVNGQTGTLMPAFGTSAGGLLTDEQINALVAGVRQRWAKPVTATPPPYASHLTADATHGAQIYAMSCASCHGTAQPGAKDGKAGSVTNPTFLALLSDQSLRTIVVAGRPDLGMPDWRGDIPGHPLSDQEVTDVVAWLASHRNPLPGQSHPDSGGTELQRRVQ